MLKMVKKTIILLDITGEHYFESMISLSEMK